MKKTTKPDAEKPAAKKPAAKKPSAKPKRKAGSSELVEIVARLAAITRQVAETAERLAQIALPASAPAPVEAPHQHIKEHADDLEVASVREE